MKVKGYAIDCPVRAARDFVPIAIKLEPVSPYQYYSYCYSYDAAEQYQDRYLGIGNPIDFHCSNEAATIFTRHTVWITREGQSIYLGLVAETIIVGVHRFDSLKVMTFTEVKAIRIKLVITVRVTTDMARDTAV